MSWHAWHSEKAQEALHRAEIRSEIPAYVDAHGQAAQVTFVTAERELDFYCRWDDITYVGIVTRKTC